VIFYLPTAEPLIAAISSTQKLLGPAPPSDHPSVSDTNEKPSVSYSNDDDWPAMVQAPMSKSICLSNCSGDPSPRPSSRSRSENQKPLAGFGTTKSERLI
jgi:hypothetical protein